jgi:hypothetical protein
MKHVSTEANNEFCIYYSCFTYQYSAYSDFGANYDQLKI